MIIKGLLSGSRSKGGFRRAAEFLELLSLLEEEVAFRRFRAVDIMWLSKDKREPGAGCFIFAMFSFPGTMGTGLTNGGKPGTPRTVECSR